MIKSFKDKATAQLFDGQRPRRLPPDIHQRARRLLVYMHSSAALSDLSQRRSARLEALKGDRQGQHSVRINDQWRICFAWRDGDAYDVEIVDYHR